MAASTHSKQHSRASFKSLAWKTCWRTRLSGPKPIEALKPHCSVARRECKVSQNAFCVSRQCPTAFREADLMSVPPSRKSSTFCACSFSSFCSFDKPRFSLAVRSSRLACTLAMSFARNSLHGRACCSVHEAARSKTLIEQKQLLCMGDHVGYGRQGSRMDDVEIRNRVHPVLDVHHICVLERSTDVHYAIHLLDV